MKRTILCIATALLTCASVFANPEANEKTKHNKENTTKPSEAEVRRINERIAEIEAMDLSELSRKERRALKKEVKEIERTAGLDSRISISVGGLIIIILLLIIIF